MKRIVFAVFLALVLVVLGTSLVFAGGVRQSKDVVAGAQLYDKWYAVLGQQPEGDMPIWGRQSTNSRSGAETWRCAECHGWDYRGVDGAYASGSHKTGFPSLMILAPSLSEEQIVAHLKGENDVQHDFSAYLDEASMQKVALFLKEGLIDDSKYIDSASLKVIDGDVGHGKSLFDATCSECHGADGAKIVFRGEGVEEYLGDVAHRDPYRFLHRTRFGVAGTTMPVGVTLGWTPADGRDVLAYAQSLPEAQETAEVTGAGQGAEPAPQDVGGPSDNWLAGIFTGILAALGTLGAAILFLFFIIMIGVAVVFVLRRSK
ncbi:MAG: c-type cytochrome [Chloroflexi bacterium]|nr:c-type cytochrome [Chloroflexota bacterium]